jgi:hypothetical protein
MSKEYYKVTYKTYYNERVKKVSFQGGETYPLYVQVTYDRKTIIFKSYYFDIFSQTKYDYFGTTMAQIDELENRVMDFVTARYADEFSLDRVPSRYKMFSIDVLDTMEEPFKEWMIRFFETEKLPGYAAMIRSVMKEVSAMHLLDEFKIGLSSPIYNRLEEKAARQGPPYIPLASFIRQKQSKGPICLPLHEWIQEEKQFEIEDFIDANYGDYDFMKILINIKLSLYPKGFW